MALFALAAIGFLLRTTGVALLAAWVMEALMRRQWRFAVVRGALALVPILVWQAHVERVRASDEYRRPAYSYQRAPYQYYNVSYAENVLLIDPFRPELGRLDGKGLATRFVRNLVRMPAALGEAVSAPNSFLAIGSRAHKPPGWRSPCASQRRMGAYLGIWGSCSGWHRHPCPPRRLADGIYYPRLDRARLHDAVARSVYALPGASGSFSRNRCCLALVLDVALRVRELRWAIPLGRLALASVLVLAFIVQAYTATWLFRGHQSATAIRFVPGGARAETARFFFHDRSWQAWEEAVAWIDAHAPVDVIVATTSPHLCYLLTGRRAVLPPMEIDPAHARRLLEAVPVSYVIVDAFDFARLCRVAMLSRHWRAIRPLGASCMKSTARESTSTRLEMQ